MDRRQAMVRGESLPDRTSGAALFADISGFTPLTNMLVKEFGPRRGAEELIKQINVVYGALIAEVHRYKGSVIGFSGDAITCWFDNNLLAVDTPPASGQAVLRATACALAMQRVMDQFAQVEIRSNLVVSLAVKVAVTTGPVRRFLVGDSQIQVIDVLAGATLDRMAEAEKLANKGEVILGPKAILGLENQVLEWRGDGKTDKRFAVVTKLTCEVDTASWTDLALSRGKISEEQVRSWLLQPVYERLRAGQERFLAELRPVVALFMKFGGINYDQDDAAGEKLDAYIRWVQSVLVRYESYLIQLTAGDKGSYLYAAFGAPLAHDDNPARALAAAIELRSPLPEMDFITGVQIGISQGQMRTGAYGSPTRRTYGVQGNEAIIAARLMEEAALGQILVSERVANVTQRSYHFEYLETVKLKGKEEPLPVYVPLGRRLPSSQRPATTFTTPLVGRDDELTHIERVLEAVLAGKGQVLCLEGAAGVGKSRLAAEFVERAIDRGLRVVLGTCQSVDQGIVYAPWRQVFCALFGLMTMPAREDDAASWTARQVTQVEAMVRSINPRWLVRLPLLGDLLGLPIPDNETTAAFDYQLRQESLISLVVEIVQSWANDRPLLLLVEDAHWMDEASQGLTMALGRAAAHAPVLLALVHRPSIHKDRPSWPDLDRLPHYNLVELRELSPQGVEALVINHLRGKPSLLALALLQTIAQGNPFFTEEMVNALIESGDLCRQDDDSDGDTWALSETTFKSLHEANCLSRDEGQWVLAHDAQLPVANLGIPDSINATVLSRFDRLPEPHKTTLKVASVTGRTFEFDLLLRSNPDQPGQDELLEQIEVLTARGFIRLETSRPQPAYTFKHNIIQDVVCQTLLEEQQRELHWAVGDAMESLYPEAIERLAYHYSRSAMHDKALFYLDKAAHKAQREYANETALNYYSRALALENRWEWRKGRIEVLHILGRREEEQAELMSLETISEAPIFEVAYLWGQYYEAVGEYSRAQAAIKQAMNICRDSGNVAGEARCLSHLGLIARRQGGYSKAEHWYDRALELLRSEDIYPDEEKQALNGLGAVHRQQGNYDQAKVCYERALTLSQAGNDRRSEARSLNELGVVALYQGHLAEALDYHRRTLEIRQAIGDQTGTGESLSNLAQVTTNIGDYGQAQAYLAEALVVHQATGNRWEEANTWNDTGVVYLLLGDLPKAHDYLQKSLELFKEIGSEAGPVYAIGNLGLVAQDQGDLATAERLLTDSLTLARKQGSRHIESLFLSHLGRVNLMASKLDRAADLANQALAMHQELDTRFSMTADLATLASVHLARETIESALDYAHQAMTILDECGGEGPEYPERDYFICYQVFAAAGQEEASHAALRSAYNLVMAKAEKIIDPTLRQSFLEQVQANYEIVQEYDNVIRGA
jgi:predicted ATPase/class 3 adenylate cyclase